MHKKLCATAMILSTGRLVLTTAGRRCGRVEMLCWYFSGMADEEELPAHIAKLQKQD